MSVPKSESIIPAQQYNLADILQYTEPKRPGIFRRVLGGVAGGAANIMFPGMGAVIGDMIGGGILGGAGGLLGESTQFLMLQQQLQAEQRAIELASTILKMKHDTTMDIIRNTK